ncbi:MAG TPA: hypothetical protein VN381_01155 [Anaerovoracaceae bacterium]|nr:hypothetical protein [Anaerovoracaceae bacterium]
MNLFDLKGTEAFNKALDVLGDIDILVNNAGTQIRHHTMRPTTCTAQS